MSYTFGEVTDATDPTHPVVQVDSETPKAIPCVDHYTPVNGHRVLILLNAKGGRVCAGKMNPPP
jgi:hypothetical protein